MLNEFTYWIEIHVFMASFKNNGKLKLLIIVGTRPDTYFEPVK